MVPFQSRSLTSRVPALTHGDFHLTESTAIAEYLEQIYPAPDHLALYPEAPRPAPARASCRHGCAATWAPCARSARPKPCSGTSPASPCPATAAAAAKLIQVSGALIGAGQATLFDAWSIADADLATALRRLWLDDLLPDTLRAYAEAQWQRPSIRKWLDHNAAARR